MRLFLALASALLLASCGSDIDVVSKDRAAQGASASTPRGSFFGFRSAGSMNYPTAPPSPAVVAAGANKPKDKHGMPFYTSERLRHVRTTAYTCSECDHLQYGSMNAAGTPLRYTSQVRSAAADWSVYPVGTTFRIKGLPYLYVVDDYGSALTGTGTVDIYKPTKDHMNAWGRRNVEIAIVRWGSYARSAEILAKRTGYAHCRQMYVAIQRRMGGDIGTAAR